MARKLGIFRPLSTSNPESWPYDGQPIYSVVDLGTESACRVTFEDGKTFVVDPRVDIIPMRPLGVYRPVAPVSLSEAEHDGQRYYACNPVGEAGVEVQFHDGEWLLCDREDLIEFSVV